MASSLFAYGNLLAMTGWVALIIALFSGALRPRILTVMRFVVPVVFALAYIALLGLGAEAFRDGGFSSITQVRALFGNDNALTAGWLHYLAFDLFVGTWITEDAGRRKFLPWLVIPCLFLTFMFGPAGYLLYLLLRLTRPQTQTD